jgi:sulfur-oxidizing protein SoxY
MFGRRDHVGTTRRRFLAGVGGAVAGATVMPLAIVHPAGAAPDSMAKAIRAFVGDANVKEGKVKLDLPPLIENGNAVSLTVAVESPMTESDHVKSIQVFNEKNPLPNVLNVHLGPRAGRARVSTRMRLSDTQTVVAIAQMSDGSFWSGSAHVIVTLPACVEESQP